MEFMVWALATFLCFAFVAADEPESAPSASPSPVPATTPREMESPLPQGTPQEQPPTILLPEPNFLPPPPALSPGNEVPQTMESAELRHTPQDESRFKEIKNAAMGSTRANYLLKEAKNALSTEARKNFMRAYYYTICAQMLRLGPDLKPMIKAYETEEIQKIASEGGSSHVTKTKGGHTHSGLVSRGSTAKKRHHYSREY
jgi:hypothetical protein